MLRSKVADSREDAAGALAWIGDSRPDVIELLIESLRTATGHQERDAAIQALGDLRAKEALPVVASVVRDTSADGDTRHTAALALARIVKRRFDRDPDVVAAALAWIDQNPKRLNGAV
jgi:HEAT repeat protein